MEHNSKTTKVIRDEQGGAAEAPPSPLAAQG